jgi:hypothetical protein
LFLTLGIISWFSADLTLAYYYFALGVEEEILFVSVADVLWFIGYTFLASHLFIVLRFIIIRTKGNLTTTIILAAIVTIFFISYNLLYLIPSLSQFLIVGDFAALVVTIAYPILDLMLIVPSILILLNLRKDYLQYIPWFLSSLSLLINAVADEGYVNDFVNGHVQNLLFWDMFYATDFIIMAGALFWYNIFHISYKRRNTEVSSS